MKFYDVRVRVLPGSECCKYASRPPNHRSHRFNGSALPKTGIKASSGAPTLPYYHGLHQVTLIRHLKHKQTSKATIMFLGRHLIISSSYNPFFARTFASGRSSLHPTRIIGGGRNPQTPSTAPHTTTEIAPGKPHYFAARIDRAAARAISTLCRCRNPDSHGDAWAINLPHAGVDLTGREISWKELLN
jgi:hypothetical protein